jgi:RHS repeat-associated protein
MSMSKVEGGDTITIEFTYNHAGLRTRKVKKVNGLVRETTEYILNGKNVVELIHIKHDTSEINRLHFHYDAQNRVALVDFNGALYSYTHNLQGDIVGILDTNGDLIVEYKYDAWGKQISVTGSLITTLGELNPFRYRGYVWDTETKLYYLINRYYSCDLCRFATPDRDIIQQYSKSFCNIYAMCLNNPIKFADYTGLDNILVIYDCRYSGFFGLFNTGVGFDKQGKDLISRLEKEGHTVDEATFTSINEFVEKWNNDTKAEYDSIYIVCHGAAGSLDCNGERIRTSAAWGADPRQVADYNDLEYKSVRYIVHLWCCNGGTKDQYNTTTMQEIANKTGCLVEAVANGGISINYFTGRVYTRDGNWTQCYPQYYDEPSIPHRIVC